MDDKFSIEEIKTYILSQDSLGDVMYYLNAENIRKANTKQNCCSYCGCDFEGDGLPEYDENYEDVVAERCDSCYNEQMKNE
jgi:hypothetical protein